MIIHIYDGKRTDMFCTYCLRDPKKHGIEIGKPISHIMCDRCYFNSNCLGWLERFKFNVIHGPIVV